MKSSMTSPLRRGAFLGLALLLCAGGASAQMYKWVDANGKTHFTDTPPPANAKPAAIRSGAPAAAVPADMPYALATAMRNFPVTLYTTTITACAGCDAGRAYLRGRGIPYTEKTVSNGADDERLRAAGGDGNLPMLVVGSAKVSGYQHGAWESMLNVALYPAKKVLPATYQYPAASAASPVAAPASNRAAEPDRDAAARQEALAREEEARRKDEAATTAPPGFRF